MSRSCQSATFSSAGQGVAAQHAREAGQALASDRVALVRHRARALLTGARTTPPPRALPCAADGGTPPPSARCSRRPARRWHELGVTVAVHDLRRDRLRGEAEPLEHARLESGDGAQTCRPRPEIVPTATCANARSKRSALRWASNAKPASLTPNVVGSACTPCVRPTHSVPACPRARAASVLTSSCAPGTITSPTARSSAAPARCRAHPSWSARNGSSAPPRRRRRRARP